jgi:O-antigen ligase
MMTVWLVWEFADSPGDLRALLRAYVAGSWILALLTLSNFSSPEAVASGQFRFVAEGQDPNDVARYLDLGFPLAALLLNCEPRWPARLLALGYLPLGLVAVVLTASRGGFLAAVLALAGCAILLARNHARGVLAGTLALPGIAASLWFFVPHETFERLATIPGQLQGGDLNQRMNIWTFGWQAFAEAPLLGSGAGTFVSASRIASMNTAHNTALSILVTGGMIALCLFAAVVAVAVRSILRTHGPLQLALATALGVWFITTLDATVEENRTTWLLLALIALAGRLALEAPQRLAACFAAYNRCPETAMCSAAGGFASRLAE